MNTIYKKCDGNPEIRNQLYKTKLISLILFRLLHDDNVEEFNLASNMDEIGSFYDVCFRVKMSGREQEALVFVQVKYEDDKDTLLTCNLIQTLHTSFFKVRENFYSNINVLFKGKFDETECFFVLYTNAKYYNELGNVALDSRKIFEGPYSNMLNSLLATSNEDAQDFQANITMKDASEIYLEEELTKLAEHFVKFLNNIKDDAMNIMLDKYILRYHVILAQSVVNISEVKSEHNNSVQWRDLTFRSDFFETDDKILAILRTKIYELTQQIKKTEIKEEGTSKSDAAESRSSSIFISDESTVDKQILTFLSEPSELTLRPLIGTHIVYNTDYLTFTVERSNDDVTKLRHINIPQLPIAETETIAARNILSSLKLRVPISFGNLDLTIEGYPKEAGKKVETLTRVFEDLCEKSQSSHSHIVRIDQSLEDEFLSPNGGICSAVGNILIYDEVTKLLKFTENSTLLKNNSQALFNKLKSKINNLHIYRFDVNTLTTFPKLVFDTDEIKKVSHKMVIYERQSNHNGIEALLKKEIEKYQKTDGLHNFPVTLDTIIIHYHDEVLRWWMCRSGIYLNKSKNNIYQQAINKILTEPWITEMQTAFNMNNMKYFRYDFNETATEHLSLLEAYSTTIIVTNISKLTTIKVIQYLRYTSMYDGKYVVLDIENILNLPIKDFVMLNTELKNTMKLVIVVCDSPKHSNILYARLDKLAQATKNNKIIVITNNLFLEIAQEYFSCAHIIYDDKQTLTDFTQETQTVIVKNTRVVYQGQDVSFDLLMDDKSVAFINGTVLKKILNNETIMISKPINCPNFEQIKHLYIDRKVCQSSNSKSYISEEENHANIQLVKTFDDISDDVVLITGTPEMGKSTFLTYLSLNTQHLDRKLWVVRINLLEHTKVFYDWKVNKTEINTLEIMKFICQVVLNNKNISISLKTSNNKICLDSSTTDEWATFELNLFLHLYNEEKMVLLFDGFDEICPLYKNELITFLKFIVTHLQKHKMWVTSRPYSEILPDLENVLGKSYEMSFIDDMEQKIYLTNYWTDKLMMEKLCDYQIRNVTSFIDFILSKNVGTFCKIVYLFFDYLYFYFPHIDISPEYVSLVSKDSTDSKMKQEDYKIMGTPAFLYLFADYFINLVCVGNNMDNWSYNIQYGILTVYETFLESKLKNLYQVKNKLDICKVDVRRRYEKEYTEYFSSHKKMAAYALIFQRLRLNELKDIDPFNESLNELETMAKEIRTGTDKIGLILHVTTDNVPVFTYRTFAEYYAAEFVCDIFKSHQYEFNLKNILYSISLVTFDMITWINKNRIVDPELNCILKDIEDKRFSFVNTCADLFTGWSLEQVIRFRSSGAEDYERDCFSQYSDDFIEILNSLESNEKNIQVIQFEKNIIAKMKPHLKKYFDV